MDTAHGRNSCQLMDKKSTGKYYVLNQEKGGRLTEMEGNTNSRNRTER